MHNKSPQQFIELMAVVVTILGTGMVYLDQSAVNVALPKLQEAFSADVSGLQWMIDIYILTLGVLLLIGGALGDLYGRVRVFVIGMIIFVLASLACGLSTSLGMLIAGRAVQGVGGALLVPGGLAMINAVVAEERRGRALGLWGTFSPLVTLSGPIVGGWMVDNVSWRAIFFLNMPLGVAATYVALRYVPETRDEEGSRRLDVPGVLSLMVGLAGVLFGLIEGPNLGWGNPLVVAALGGGVAGLAVFVIVERRSSAPMLPLNLFRNLPFTGINAMTLLIYFAMSSVFFFQYLNLQQVQGYTALQAGLAALPSTLMLALLARWVGKLTDRIGPAPLMTIGCLIICASYFLYALPGVGDSRTAAAQTSIIPIEYWTTFFPASLVFGLGAIFTYIPLTSVALGSLPNRYSGIASGFNNAVTRIAQMVAVAVFGALMADVFRAGMVNRLAAVPLGEAAHADLLSRVRDLGAIAAPDGLAPAVAEAVRQAVGWSFVDAFRQMMYVSIAVTLAALAVMLATVRNQRAVPVREAEVAVSAD